MTNDELAKEIEKRRGGSIEYLGKLLWSNSSRIIAALRRSITAYSHLTQEQFDQLVRDAMSWRTRPPSGEMVPEHAMLFSAAILVSDALHNEELQGAELKASTDTAWEKLSFAIEASRKALSAAEAEGRKR